MALNPRAPTIRNPPQTTIPTKNRVIRQKPMISLADSPAIPSAGSAQNGCIILVQASPQAIAMPVIAELTPSSAPAGIIIGPCTPHCPPPEGTKIYTKPAERKVNSGKVIVVEIAKTPIQNTTARDWHVAA